MVLVNKTLNDMLDDIGTHRVTFNRSITPNDNEAYKKTFDLVNGETGYDDLLLSVVLFKVGHERQADSDYLHDLLEACIFEEAFRLGNRSDPNLPITIQTYDGRKGDVFRIGCQGGFNYTERIKYVRDLIKEKGDERTNEEHYEEPHVMAILLLDDPGIEASYEKEGSVVNIKVPNSSSR